MDPGLGRRAVRSRVPAGKIPVVDSVWDGIQAFIRSPAGTPPAALALSNHDPV
jgi:hypothetical protein